MSNEQQPKGASDVEAAKEKILRTVKASPQSYDGLLLRLESHQQGGRTYGFSKAVISEAFHQLSQDGSIVFIPQDGERIVATTAMVGARYDPDGYRLWTHSISTSQTNKDEHDERRHKREL